MGDLAVPTWVEPRPFGRSARTPPNVVTGAHRLGHDGAARDRRPGGHIDHVPPMGETAGKEGP